MLYLDYKLANLDLQMFDPVFNATFTWTNTESRWWDNNISLPIWVANAQENDNRVRFSGGMMWPGSSARGQLPRHVFEYDHEANWTSSIDTVMSWLTHETEPANCAFLYFDQPDAMAHMWGPFSEQVMSEVRRADDIIGLLIRRLREAGLFEEMNLIILSDHGMAEINADRIIELDKFVDRKLYDMYGASPLWNILPHAGQEVFQKLLNASRTNHFFVYAKDSVPAEYHYRSSRRIMPLVVVAEDGYDIVAGRDQIGDEQHHRVWGNHGYNNSEASMQPLFLAQGPAFKRGLVFEKEFENVDLYPLMCYVLELFPITRFPSNGTLGRVYEMLKPRPASSENFMLSLFFAGMAFGGIAVVLMAGCVRKRTGSRLARQPGTHCFHQT